jgi:uncharacterized metal-binding protein
MSSKNQDTAAGKVIIVPCSGIGKTYGSVSREAAYEVTDALRPAESQLVALSLLVLGDEEALAAVSDNPTITIDGCKLACANKMVKENGGTVTQDFAVGIAELNEGGLKLAQALAEEVAAVVDSIDGAAGSDDIGVDDA